MLIPGDDLPVVVCLIAQCARIAGGARHVIAYQHIWRAVIGFEIDVVGHRIAWVRVTASPTQVRVYAPAGGAVTRNRVGRDIGWVVGERRK